MHAHLALHIGKIICVRARARTRIANVMQDNPLRLYGCLRIVYPLRHMPFVICTLSLLSPIKNSPMAASLLTIFFSHAIIKTEKGETVKAVSLR